MNFYILTLFPEMVMSGLNASITGRAIQQNKISIEAVDIRDYTQDKHGRVDDYTYGGGAGMLIQAQPVYDVYVSVRGRIPDSHKKRVIYVTPQGRPFTQQTAKELADNDDLVLLCGHYEGVDERVLDEIVTDYISIGDYVLTGGELAAMVIVDAVARLVPGVLHNDESAHMESFHGNLLEYPQYSRPEEWHGRRVPPVLLSGNQREIDKWRRLKSEERTAERRPDLYERYLAVQECEKALLSDKLHHMDMIELIRSGRARLVAREGAEILLEDCETHVWYHTCPQNIGKTVKAGGACLTGHAILRGHATEKLENNINAGKIAQKEEIAGKDAQVAEYFAQLSDSVLSDWMERLCRRTSELVLHQAELIPVLESLGYRLERECVQCVCTRREQLPISGLYGADGRDSKTGLGIRTLAPADYVRLEGVLWSCGEPARDLYDNSVEKLQSLLRKDLLCGAFFGEALAGVIGAREDGCVDLLEVLPQYRRRRIATALETYLFNLQIQNGRTPYAQVDAGNHAFLALQEKLGVCVAKERIYWMKI